MINVCCETLFRRGYLVRRLNTTENFGITGTLAFSVPTSTGNSVYKHSKD